MPSKQFTIPRIYAKIVYAVDAIQEKQVKNKESIMPNIKSAKKRVLVTEKKTMQNKAVKSALKTQIKKFLTAVESGNKEEATKLYPETVSAIDAAASKGVIHKNNANNRKAKLAKKLDAMGA